MAFLVYYTVFKIFHVSKIIGKYGHKDFNKSKKEYLLNQERASCKSKWETQQERANTMTKSRQNRQCWHMSGVARDDNKRQVTNSGNRNETLATAASHNNLHQ